MMDDGWLVLEFALEGSGQMLEGSYDSDGELGGRRTL